jgi:hypothetical protein
MTSRGCGVAVGRGGVGTVVDRNRTKDPLTCAAAVVPLTPRCTFTNVLPNLAVYAICSLSISNVPAPGNPVALSTEMLLSDALTAETSRALVTGDPVRVAEGVGVAVAPAGGVGVGVPGDAEPVGDTVRVRVGVAVPRSGVFVGLDVAAPWQMPAGVHGGVTQQSLSSTQESFWKSDVHVEPGQSVSSLHSVPWFEPPAHTPAQNLPVLAHCEPLHWLSRRHGSPLKPDPPPKQTFDVPVHGALSAQLKDVSQHSPANSPPEHVPIVASVLHTGWPGQLPPRHWHDRPSSPPPSQTP